MSCAAGSLRRVGWVGAVGLGTALAVAGVVRGARAQVDEPPSVVNRGAPTASYFAVFSLYYEGEYREALKEFKAEGRGAIKNGPGNHWVDSICYHTMAGECYYQMGQFAAALEHYTAALQLYLAYSDWMVRVRFEPVIRPANPGKIKQVPWGQSQRLARLGSFSETTLIGQGRINQTDVVRQGGVVQPPVLYPMNVHEIVRCTALAMRRRRELMGPACPHDKLTNKLVIALGRRPGLPNHWSEAYIGTQLGLAYAAAGRDAQAKRALELAVVAAGEFDHPLTPTVLLELGRLALAGGDFGAAENWFGEATYAAVNFGDGIVLEEAFRAGLLTHLVANRPGLYPPLATAAAWARVHDLRQLHASLLVLAAENHSVLGQPKVAAELLAEARSIIGRRDMLAGRLGARLHYTSALALYQQANVPAGDTALEAALAFQRTGSLWLFHMGLVDNLWTGGVVRERTAMDLYSLVLRDPTPADWATDPLESLSSLVVPHHALVENWFEVALVRKEHERALEIADQARRHRFLNTLELGGRLLNLRWVLEGPAEMLDQRATLQRQDLLVHYPAYGQLSQQAQRLRGELAEMPLAPDDPDAAKLQAAKLAELAQVSLAGETILREMALRREPCDIVFPPRRATKEVQEALAEGEALLAFFATSRNWYAFLMTNDKYGHWPIALPKTFQRHVVTLLREWGNYDQNKELKLADLGNPAWKKPAKEILDTLMTGSQADLAGMFEELVVVPDGLLWYIPFEALQFSDGDQTRPLLSKLRVRYAPTVGLAVADPRPRRQGGNTAVVLGRLFPRDADDVAETAFAELGRAVPGAVPVRAPLPAPSAVYSSLFDRLIVYSDVASAEAGPYDWSPVPIDRGSPASALGNWFALPWGGPEQVILPGFHTSAENALKRQASDMAGAELFLSVCGLMSTGSRTVLISRWRTGGQTSFDLVREFAQELPYTTAADAWQRSVLLVSDMPVNPELEPRLKADGHEEPPTAEHPFFWAGYLLADSGTPPGVSDEDPAAKVLVAKEKPAPARQKPDREKPPQAKDDVPGGPPEDEAPAQVGGQDEPRPPPAEPPAGRKKRKSPPKAGRNPAPAKGKAVE